MGIVDWIQRDDIRPFLYIRKENRTAMPGASHPIDWFSMNSAIYLNPLKLKNLEFAEAIYKLEGHSFSESYMQMPRWVFYDCAVMPGIIVGYAIHIDSLTDEMKKVLKPTGNIEWLPISMFIAIPTNASGQWVAHNLCSINYFLPKEEKLKALGFLTKAFGLWYANIQNLCGMTQWNSPALKLHSRFGNLQILAAYSPVHTHATTLTYKTWVDSKLWFRYFSNSKAIEFSEFFEPSGITIDPKNEESMKVLQRKIERLTGPYYLSGEDIHNTPTGEEIKIYKLKKHLRRKINF